jgi:hypothetical protein
VVIEPDAGDVTAIRQRLEKLGALALARRWAAGLICLPAAARAIFW